MSSATSKPHPVMIIAAISVIILSATGVSAIMGWIPSSTSKTSEQIVTQPSDKVTETQLKTESISPVKKAPATKSENNTSEKETSSKAPDKKPTHVATTESRHKKTTMANSSNSDQVSRPSPPPAAPTPTCHNCGSISSINAIEQAGEGTGLGAIAGGVAGALLGSQIGQGNGTTVATIAGAAGGAYAGHQVEKRVKKTSHVEINIRMDDGTYKTISQPNDSGLMVGDKVKIVDGVIVRN